MICVCGHDEVKHRQSGACMAIIEREAPMFVQGSRAICTCNDYAAVVAKRIQRRRSKGWRMPEGAAYVGRPTKWGNPFAVGTTMHSPRGYDFKVRDRAHAVDLYRDRVFRQQLCETVVSDLAGKDLACWCPLDQPCHADVLLDIANAAAEGEHTS